MTPMEKQALAKIMEKWDEEAYQLAEAVVHGKHDEETKTRYATRCKALDDCLRDLREVVEE